MTSEALRDDLYGETPVGHTTQRIGWGSDAIAEMLRQLDIPYVALNPGASYRGLHDSLVNYLGNRRPQMLMVLHEQHAVAIAHGYAKVTGKPMAAALHSNVGLMNASMAIYNAWCDRVPVLVMGATGPVDAARRRPWIDWLHTSRDQAALTRNFTKWDDQPASVEAAMESMIRGLQIANTAPNGPVHIVFDVSLQERDLSENFSFPDLKRGLSDTAFGPTSDQIAEAEEVLKSASKLVILAGRVSRDERAWQDRVRLAEALEALVVTDMKVGAAFPTRHQLHRFKPDFNLDQNACHALREADAILSLDWVDLGGTLQRAFGDRTIDARIIQVSADHLIHNGWSMDHMAFAPADIRIQSEPDEFVSGILSTVDDNSARSESRPEPKQQTPADAGKVDGLDLRVLASSLNEALADHDACFVRLPLGWPGDLCQFSHPLDYLGLDGGGGIGSGPGLTVGAALALRNEKRMPVAVLGDGDLLMGATALWTASKYRIPALIVVANNRSFFNDELHQERVARARSRPVENRWIGQRIDDPAPDIAGIAGAQGWKAEGPIGSYDELRAALARGIDAVSNGEAYLIDVLVERKYESNPSGLAMK